MENYFVIDIETAPLLPFEEYERLEEEKQQKLMNPIDSKIIAAGIRYNKEDYVFFGEDEREILKNFWNQWRSIVQGQRTVKIVGFNILNFDIPFLVTKSCIHNVPLSPFVLKDVVDLREKVHAYRYGKNRGTLKEFASALGITLLDVDGSDVARLYHQKDFETITTYLKKDLEITEALLHRMHETGVIHISRY
jgi:DNA polymerase elongation subunit (family B)